MMCTLVAAGEKVVELVVEKGRMLVLFPYMLLLVLQCI
jgi:hypothetical protein